MTIALAAVMALCIPQLMHGTHPRLAGVDHSVSLLSTHGRNLPITFDQVQSCGCWDGPHGMAQKKFKFKITNGSPYSLNIGGGIASNIRLLVALPNDTDATIVVPKVTRSSLERYAAMPANVPLTVAIATRTYRPPHLVTTSDIFRLGDGWTIYMYPPNEERVAEGMYGDATTDGVLTFPTYVGRKRLDPGQSYYDPQYGHGAWVFYVPVTEDLFTSAIGTENIIPEGAVPADSDISAISAGPGYIPRSITSKFINVLGLAVIDPESSELLGFTPVPTESMVSDPTEF